MADPLTALASLPYVCSRSKERRYKLGTTT